MHFRDSVAVNLQPHHCMRTTLGQEHTAHLRIGSWPIVIAAATKGQRVGFRLGRVEHRAINGHEPLATKERTWHAGRLGDHLTALTHQCLEALASQCLATSAQSRITDRTLGLSRMDSARFPTKLCHTWHWFRRLHSAIPITNTTRVKAVLSRTCRTLLDQGSLCSTHRSITSVGYTSLSIVILTCSHTLSSTSISRNLYIESSLGFSLCFLVVCQIGAFLSCFSLFWLK